MNAESSSIDISALWKFSDPELSETRFRNAQAEASETQRLELETQIARTQGLRKKFDDAHATLDAVDAVRGDAAPIVNVRYLLERGRVFNSSGAAEKARPLFLEAWELGRSAKIDGLAVDAAHMMGIIEPPEAAMEWNTRALELAERSPDPTAQKWRASLHNNIGWSHHDALRFDKALEHFERGLELRREMTNPDATRIAKWSVARALRSLKRYDDALKLQLELETEWSEVGGEDGFVFEELGELYLALEEPEKARPYFARALPLLDAMGWIDAKRLARIRTLADE